MLCEDTDSESSQTEAPPPRHVSVFLVIFVGAVMMSGIRHPYLWAQDEPREAEIARETLVDGHWVTPHLCGLPFLEKPPLYYDLVAAAYAVTGSISPTTARAVSAAFGMIMLAGMFFLCRRWAGLRAAFLAVLVILSMPKFYYYSHLILLDIAVGAFCTVAMTAFAFWLWWPGSSAKKQTLLCLFYLASAGAFMTKGVVGIFHVIVIIAVFCIITWQWQTLRKLIFAWPIFIFILPAAVWVYLFYREGGIPYLYEHFVNNTVGRFLRVQFALRNVHFHHTDLGKAGSWHFYITSLPVILGASIALVPLAIWNAAAKAWAGWQNHTQSRNPQDDMQFLLLTWAIVPAFLLSFPAAKETSYIIPSYAAMAILTGAWLDSLLPKTAVQQWQGVGWLSIAAIVAILSIFLSEINAKVYLGITAGFAAITIPVLAVLLFKKRFVPSCFVLAAALTCVPVICFAPNVQHDFHQTHCALPLAKEVWARTVGAQLYLYQPKDMVRGSIPFYANRTVRELDVPEDLRAVLMSGQRIFILMDYAKLKAVHVDELPEDLYTIQPLPDFALNKKFILLTNRTD